MKSRIFAVLLLAAVMLPLTGCIAGFDYTPGPYVPSVYLDYDVIDSGGNFIPQIMIYPANASGSVTPSILGDTAGSIAVTTIATDRNGYIYAALYDYNISEAEIVVFAPGSAGVNGSTLPIRSFRSSFMTATVQNLTVDPGGNVYAYDSSGNLYKFAPTAQGTTSSLLMLSGINANAGMTTDSHGNFYLAVYPSGCSCTGNAIYVYSAGFTSATPENIINPPASEYIDGLAVDASGTIYASGELTASGTGQIEAYASTATGSATPIRTITGSNTLLSSSSYNTMAMDAAGTLYVRSLNIYAPGGTSLINEFPSTANGNVAPAVSIAAGLPLYYPNISIAVY